jgi:cysteine-rich repeat protein
MYPKPIICIAALASLLISACSDGQQSSKVSNTAVELVISDLDDPSADVLPLIDFVSYRINCPESGLTPFDNSVDLNGNFAVNEEADPPVWQVVMSLPLSTCTVSFWVFYEEQVICSGTEIVTILEASNPAAPSKVSLDIVCQLSVDPPSGPVEIDADFDFIDGNFCPKLNWVGALPIDVPPGNPTTTLEVSAFDPDETCGLNCDPRTCDFTVNPPECTSGVDPGFSAQFFAPSGLGSFSLTSAAGTPLEAESVYTCDLDAPGLTEICVTVTDGDGACDKTRCVTIDCPSRCDDIVCVEDDNECTRVRCDPDIGECVYDDVPNGIACDSCTSTCQSGACDAGTPFVAEQNAVNMSFVGTLQLLNQTIVNPYSGEEVELIGEYLVNTSSYRGVSSDDTLFGTNQGDVLFVEDPVGSQRICGVENLRSENGFDVAILANEYIELEDMTIVGGAGADFIWANVGDDNISGNGGEDIIDGGPGNDQINGGPGEDQLTGGLGDDTIDGGAADDSLTMGADEGFDSIDGGAGTDRLDVKAAQDLLRVTVAANPSYEFDVWLDTLPIAEIRNIEFLRTTDTLILLPDCTGPATDACNLCGNGVPNGGEQCDDGGNVDGDGCASDCTLEF